MSGKINKTLELFLKSSLFFITTDSNDPLENPTNNPSKIINLLHISKEFSSFANKILSVYVKSSIFGKNVVPIPLILLFPVLLSVKNGLFSGSTP